MGLPAIRASLSRAGGVGCVEMGVLNCLSALISWP